MSQATWEASGGKGRERENADYAAMLKRMIRSYIVRVSEGDETDLAEMLEVGKLMDEAVAATVQRMKASQPDISWATVSEATGTTRQAAQMRFSKFEATDELVSFLNGARDIKTGKVAPFATTISASL